MKKIIKKEYVGIQPVFSTNVDVVGNYVSEGNIINKNCVVDQDYQGELMYNLHNIGNHEQVLKPGEKIVQGVLLPMAYMETEEVSTVEELYDGSTSTRGEGGFGSTGVK